ncbi:MAG TPA: zinc ribbon domain-containing protein [Gemmatimonadales bacterium]|nr:zinc ribbon domain-containing protein [Gemmatimonadales bacterium]
MTQPATARCPSCGAATTGNFCSACGAAAAGRSCPGCGGTVPPGGRFCSQCGRPVGAAPSRDRPPGSMAFAAGVVVLGLLLAVVVQWDSRQTPAAAEAAAAPGALGIGGGAGGAAGGGVPPDISAMSPRERFDRLYNRVMQAAESGDEGTVTRFTPMALAAYAQLPERDADARYHAALLEVHTGDAAAALALADTILAEAPGHLFAYVIRGTVARWQKDDAALARAYKGFQGRYEVETSLVRPEYADHKRALDDFRQAAEGSRKNR